MGVILDKCGAKLQAKLRYQIINLGNKMTESMLTQKLLNELLDYNPETGILKWKSRGIPQWDAVYSGENAGTIEFGYIRVSINKKVYRAHRVIWIMVTGDIPSSIDHINHNRSDNRIINLRHVSVKENSKNLSVSKRNKTGVTGVSFNKVHNKWQVNISICKVNTYLGRTLDFFEACCMRKSAEIRHGYHANHGRAI